MDPAGVTSVPELLARMDSGWAALRGALEALPPERLDEGIGDGGWTRKEMLAHLVAWHDLTTSRVERFMASGEPSGLDEHEDAINARAAGEAIGRAPAEVVRAVDDSFARLRTTVARLTDTQLAAHDWFALAIVRGNSFGHYEEHLPDL